MHTLELWTQWLLLLFTWLLVDDPLSGQAQELIDLTAAEGASDSYYFLLGFSSPQDVDPAAYGRLLERVELAAANGEDLPAEVQARWSDWQSRELQRPAEVDLCGPVDAECLRRLFIERIDQPFSETAQVLLQRLDAFDREAEYDSGRAPDFALLLSFADFQMYTAACRLRWVQILQTSSPTQSVAQFQAELLHARAVLSRQDTLIGKMVLLWRVSATLDVLFVAARRAGVRNLELAPLSAAEKDLRRVMAYEFTAVINSLRHLDDPNEYIEVLGWPASLQPVLFKPHMLGNAMAPMYQRVADWARQDAWTFEQALNGPAEQPPMNLLWRVRNPVGKVILSVGPDMSEYPARIIALDAKMALFNALVGAAAIDDGVLHSLPNPYRPDAPGAEFDEATQAVCFAHDHHSDRGDACLLVAAAPETP